jgi:hypothetical protein
VSAEVRFAGRRLGGSGQGGPWLGVASQVATRLTPTRYPRGRRRARRGLAGGRTPRDVTCADASATCSVRPSHINARTDTCSLAHDGVSAKIAVLRTAYSRQRRRYECLERHRIRLAPGALSEVNGARVRGRQRLLGEPRGVVGEHRGRVVPVDGSGFGVLWMRHLRIDRSPTGRNVRSTGISRNSAGGPLPAQRGTAARVERSRAAS